ncbi:MAG: 23S rRNA (adenine(2503)-C(2))-methyltransferase RlmN [Deltaproteobacteria bacterium]|jgi:23S rRNA (adenine2503-C2)-methyltransferase|nr:23S rRNA (adenine(2503)-C(2))-methyltransferase RlmN [Deltaproteobacteria bacterium]
MSGRPNLKDYSLVRLREHFVGEGLPAYRADQIAGWIYQRGVEDFSEMSDLDLALRERLQADWQVRCLEVERLDRSADGTLKAILLAGDGAQVESVLIPEADRTTLCVSTQVGCAMACTFCATGALGFTRNLTTAEIVEQVCRMGEILDEPRKITNIVFMGMGEPLLNLRAVSEAIAILVNPKMFAMAPRRVTVSTVGVLPRIEELLDVAPINLAVSLHATTDSVRDRLVPLNRRYPLDALLDLLRRLDTVNPRRPVFFEYTLIEGVNDSLEDARRLPALLRGIPSKLNLIPMNPHPESTFRPPSDAAIDAFLRVLAGAGMTVTLRRSRGDDIGAACGQLALRRAGAAAA